MWLKSIKNLQAHFKQNFVTLNQNYRQKAKHTIEREFDKLMNNDNCRFDCRSNINNVEFIHIIGEINKISNIKKYYNLFNLRALSFVNRDLFE